MASGSNTTLKDILQVLELHSNAIKDSKEILKDIEKNINDHEKPLVCCFDLDEKMDKKKSKEKILSDKDKLYQYLANEIQTILNADEQTIPADSKFTDLLRSLVNLFIMENEGNLKGKTMEEILDFLHRNESIIDDFLSLNCKQKILECLKDEIKNEKILLTEVQNAAEIGEQGIRAMDNVTSTLSQEIGAHRSNSVDEKGAQKVTLTSPPIMKAQTAVVNTKENDMESSNLRDTMEEVNTIIEGQYDALVKDQLEGLQQMDKKYSQVLIKQSPDLNTKNSTLSSEGERNRSRAMQKLIDKFGPWRRNTVDTVSEKRNTCELIVALDDALDELESKIRTRIYNKFDPDLDTDEEMMSKEGINQRRASRQQRASVYSLLKSMGI